MGLFTSLNTEFQIPSNFNHQELYDLAKTMFNENGIDKIKIITDNKQHINYLKSMNFKSEQNNTYYLSLE